MRAKVSSSGAERPSGSGARADASQPVLAALPPPRVRPDTFQRGIIIGPLLAPDDEDTFKREHAAILDRAAELGATDVQLLVRWLQTDPTANEIAPVDSVDDELLSWIIDQARRRKLRVQLAPVIGVEAASSVDATQARDSTPALRPRDAEQWWWSFRRFVVHYARVSGMRKVARLNLGRGLTHTELQHERWRALIAEVRKVYKGQLSYAANPDSLERITFWDGLDVIGVVVDPCEAGSEAQQIERLTPVVERLARTAKTYGRDYVLSEGECGPSARDSRAALRCRRALYQAFGDQAQLSGVYVRPGDLGSSAEPAPAAEVVRHWYGKSRG